MADEAIVDTETGARVITADCCMGRPKTAR